MRHCEEERRSNPEFKLIVWTASYLAVTQSASSNLLCKLNLHIYLTAKKTAIEMIMKVLQIILLQLLQLQLKKHKEEWATCSSVCNFLVSLRVEW